MGRPLCPRPPCTHSVNDPAPAAHAWAAAHSMQSAHGAVTLWEEGERLEVVMHGFKAQVRGKEWGYRLEGETEAITTVRAPRAHLCEAPAPME